MQLELTELRADDSLKLSCKNQARFKLDIDEVEMKTFGLEVCDVLIENEQGETARFFVTARIKNGRAVLVVTAKKNNGKETIKSVVGDWRL